MKRNSCFCSHRNWLRGHGVALLSIALCISVVFSLEPVRPGANAPSSVSINPVSKDYALLPTVFRLDSSLPRAKLSKTDGRPSSTLDMTSVFGTYSTDSQDSYYVSDCASYLDSISKRGFRQACQLLDIPPPSDIVSS